MAILKTKKADLNIHYKKYFQISMILVLSILIAAFKFSPRSSEKHVIQDSGGCIINIIDVPQTDQNTRPQLPPRPQIPEIATVDNIVDIEFEPTDIDINANISKPIQLENPSNRIVENEEHIPFFSVEIKPEIIGGLESILKNVYYTEIAKRAMIEGRVSIEFIVNQNGDVENAKVLKGISEELDLIALNAVKHAKFKPGLQRGKPVNVKMVIPIVFRLK